MTNSRNLDYELGKANEKIEQLEGFKTIQNEMYGKDFIELFEQFNPFEISHADDYGCYVTFHHPLNFQGTNGAFQEFAKRTGLIPVAWWHEDNHTTIAFDKVFYPQTSAIVAKDIHEA